MSFTDFQELKTRVSFEQAINLLGLTLKRSGNQWRGACPVCKGSDRSLVITEGKGFFCFTKHAGGDVIALVAHIRGIAVKEAAQFLADTLDSPKATVPQVKVEGKEGGFKPLDYLEPEHDAVKAIGFDPEFCKAHGIGYAPKGMMRGTVAIPFRDEHGTLLGYLGIEDAKLPPSFTTNVVPFGKKSA